ncbi:hypothetical protein RKD47_006602 [Streptomyces albogriseolus]
MLSKGTPIGTSARRVQKARSPRLQENTVEYDVSVGP